MRVLKYPILFILLVFVMPAAASAGWWALQDRPGSWREADWSSAGILPPAKADRPAAIYVMAARTGGMKGAISVHSWIVTKPENGAYSRYDKVGWGSPVRRNNYAPDARWYSNRPFFVRVIRGPEATRLIPEVEAAIASYPYSGRGDYTMWPGPNSNSFVAHVIRSVPELEVTMPSNAIGRDFRPGWLSFDHDPDWSNIHVSIGGLFGFAAGFRSGLEMHLLGLVAGFDFIHPAIKIPGFGRLELA